MEDYSNDDFGEKDKSISKSDSSNDGYDNNLKLTS